MGSRMKENEKIEREIRNLAKLPENRRCINCNSLGPQYVCTTFWTFVCTNCSGIQREFNHRVKSVSMAKFTPEEVSALQAGGNERAKQIYFKDWDPQRQSYPDPNNLRRLRDFIKQVYVERKFTGERNQNNLPRLKLNNKNESNDGRKLSVSLSERFEYRNDIRSPSSQNEDGNVKFYYDDRRSPRYAPRNANQRRNTVKVEVVDDRFRDNKSRTRRFLSIEPKETPVLFDDVQRNVDGEKDAPASGEGSVKENQVGQKIPETATTPEAQSTSQSNDGSSWATFQISTENESSQIPSTNTSKFSTKETTTTTTETKPKTLDAVEVLLSELSGPLYATASSVAEVHTADNDASTARNENISVDVDLAPPTLESQITSSSPINVAASSVTSTSDSDLTQPSTACSSVTQSMRSCKSQITPSYPINIGASSVTSTSDSDLTQPSTACSSVAQSMTTSFIDAPSLKQPEEVSPEVEDLSNSVMELSLQVVPEAAHDTGSDVRSQKIAKTKSDNGRKELPEDLFTMSYLPASAPQAGWQKFRPHNMGYDLQYYPNAAPISAFATAAKSTNPFDVNEGRPQLPAFPIPTISNMHGPQTAMSGGGGLMRASSFGAYGSIIPQFPNHVSSIPPQFPLTTTGFPAGAYFEQANKNMQAPRPQRAGSFNGETTLQRDAAGGYSAPGYYTQNSFPETRGGNPFG